MASMAPRHPVRGWLWAATLAVVVACSPATQRLDWATVDELIAEQFPDVAHITTKELADSLEMDRSVVLLDAREPDEFAVSHLGGAVLARSVDEAADVVAQAGPNALVVVYCSVGYRSAALAAQLRTDGGPEVVNLEGSIFAWANEGRPLYRGDTRVSAVHPYDESWGVLLHHRLWPTTIR